ncbi:anaerobic glycerol-3-phosphate dehydrogenase subunit C [Rhodopirellula sp. MGV]|uniref:anaerobic glycerol-3-phosphate dehydrogenase subunit C n=1 Tax=Rhodopirellula sp. MGV TaxID=2023130 RepID=UPI000B975C8D|nr:anaerobic glycerol-3-phosphate dehydrogenase subunit C [Rhodopirellula sp. MGV]OYP35184.1 anaerobic glycerol-3-phosphate dehydrogenase subunit C [Rhodopirellula sp. MGV]PNY37802.1 anaerobic glycerol-3-phosphate dehydrogenase subunit C [Rhodopirellula baltica]
MEIDRQRIQDDLRGIVRGDVLCDDVSRTLYSTDASIYELQPIGVIRPRSAADVVAIVRYASEHDVPLHPRGAGSGVSGESIGPGLVLDFSRYMRRMQMDRNDGHVVVEAGTTLAELNRSIRSSGRWFGPDPATRSITTLGSVLATNASGSHFLRSGSARDNVHSLRVVTMEGELLDVSRHHPTERGIAGRLARGLVGIRDQHRECILAQENGAPARSGYRFDDVIDEHNNVDLAKFLCGTQGTLALIVEATVKTEAIPKHRGVVALFFHRLESAARSAVVSLKHGPVACDMIGRRLLGIARETERQFESMLPREAEAMLLLELQGDSLAELKDRIELLKQELTRGPDGAFKVSSTTDQKARDQYWKLCRRVTPRLGRLRGREMPVPFTEDIAVDPQRLPEALIAIQKTLRDHECTSTVFAHAGHGQLHVRPFLDLSLAEDRNKIRQVAHDVAEVVWKMGGQVSVEHAAGLSRSALLPRQFGDFWLAMGQVKRLFDPHHRLNPGKLFGAVLQQPDENLRPIGDSIRVVSPVRTLIEPSERVVQESRLQNRTVPELPVMQQWPANKMVDQVAQSCNGCGRCRTTAMNERQCPVYRTMRIEEATPRAKANLLRGVLSGKIDVESLAGERAKSVADLCFNCHQCRVECPATVDIPKIVGELKAHYVSTNGLPLSDRLFTRLDTIAGLGSRLPRISNFVLQNRVARWLAEQLFGLVSSRELPSIAETSFIRYAARRRWTKRSEIDGTKVLYFVDHYANYHDPDIGRALAEVLQQNGIGLYVPTSQSGSGMARITAGDLKGARRIGRRNLRLLAEAIRSGYTVVATEPSAVLCLKHEYPNLFDDEDAYLVAKHSYEACDFLVELNREGKLDRSLNEVPVHFAYHRPCHLRVLDPDLAAVQLLNLIPGLDVDHVEGGCSGMAGTWGLQRRNYRNSLRIGWPMISAMRSSGIPIASTECSACKMQIEHAAGMRTVHPIKLLAYAYGRFPKVGEQLGLTQES